MRNLASSIAMASLIAGSILSATVRAQTDPKTHGTRRGAQIRAVDLEAGQSDAGAKAKARQKAQLERALRKMAGLKSMSFATVERTLGRQRVPQAFGGMGKRADQKSTGLVQGDLLRVKFGEDTVLRRGRTTVMGENGKWEICDDVSIDGGSSPVVLDPSILFRILARQDLELARATVGEWDQRPVQLMSIKLSRKLCTDLVRAGLVPDPSQRGTEMLRFFVGGGKRVIPRVEGYAVLAVDPVFGFISGIRFRLYHDAAKAGAGRGMRVQQIAFQVGGKAVVSKEIRELDEIGEGEVRWEDGLPRRALAKREVRVDFEISFSNHDKVEEPQLDEAARELLGMKAPR